MSVYVDMLLPCIPNPRWHHRESCHLVADTLVELHAFAEGKLGLHPSWFQSECALPHFDLTRGKRARAIQLGAIPLDTRASIKETWPKCEGYNGPWKVKT